MYDHAVRTEAYLRRCQDRAEVLSHPEGLVLVVADGAGGTGGGEEAAETLIMWVRALVTRGTSLQGSARWVDLLARVDQQISCGDGQTTGVVVALSEHGVAGASVGDSVAWILGPESTDDLTAGQIRKPLLGTGHAKPVGFERPQFIGTLLLASDGLANYAPRPKIRQTPSADDLAFGAQALINLVRLKSGSLPDDVAVILCRKKAQAPTITRTPQKHYELTADGEMVERDPA